MQVLVLLLTSSAVVGMVACSADMPFDIPQPRVMFHCDIDFDGLVEMDDLLAIAGSFGATRRMPHWNPLVDVNADGIVDIFDVSLAACRLEQT
jgi:hypothetical protein